MKVIATAGILASTLKGVAAIVPARSNIPVLQNVSLRTGDGFLEIRGTNLDQQITATLPARTEGEAGLTVEASRLSAFLAGLPDAETGIEADKNVATMRCGKRSARLPVIPAEDYPELTFEAKNATRIECEHTMAARFAALIEMAEIGSESRPFLDSLNLSGNGPLLARAGSSPGLVQEQFAANVWLPNDKVMLPTTAVRLFPKLFAESFVLEIGEGRARASDGRAEIITKLLAGAYPGRAFEAQFSDKVGGLQITVDAGQLVSAARRLASITQVSDDQGSSGIQIVAGDGMIMLRSQRHNGTLGAEDEIEAECDSGMAFRSFTVGEKALQRIVTALGAETLRFSQRELGGTIHIEAIGCDTKRGALGPYRGNRTEVQAEAESEAA